MKLIIGEDKSEMVCDGCGNRAEVGEEMVKLLDIAMKLEVICAQCGKKLIVEKEGVTGAEKIQDNGKD